MTPVANDMQPAAAEKAFWRDRPVLITGGTGLVGSWLTQRLMSAGASVVALVRDWVPQSELVRSRAIERVTVVRADVRDQEVLERALGEYEIDTVFHLAAQTIVGVANRNPAGTLDVNVRGTWAMLEACRRNAKVAQVIVASSDKAYGYCETLPYSESVPLRGRHPYDVSKSCADLISQMYAASYGMRVAVARCGNFYGGGDLNWTRIVPGTIRSLTRGKRPIVRSDGKFVRDYFYVEDGAAAYMTLAHALAERPDLAGEAFNFSLDDPLTVFEMVERIKVAMGINLDPLILNQASNEIPTQYLDSSKARNVLGWRPLFTFDQGLARTVAWYRNFLDQKAA